MDNTYMNIISFIFITLAYFFVFKPKLTIGQIEGDLYLKYVKSTYFCLILYFLFILLIQFAVNIGNVINTCGGSVTENISSAAFNTFIPWVFIFGTIIAIMISLPGFKGVFSDVLGYFFVASSANVILSKLLINPTIDDAINNETAVTGDTGNKKLLQSAADVIIKLSGDMSKLINQIVPSNFSSYWNVLKPLMKPEYVNELNPETIILKNKLLDLVVMRDNIGEGSWYLYTAILLISIVQYNIASKGCMQNSATMQAKYKAYVKHDEAAKAQTDNTTTTYTLG